MMCAACTEEDVKSVRVCKHRAVASYFKVVWPKLHVICGGVWGHAPPGKFC